MNAEKEIVNYWYQQQGYFTVTNLKCGNKDIGLLAIKGQEVLHIEVVCSVSSSQDSGVVQSVVKEKFQDKKIQKTIKQYTNKESTQHILVINHSSQKESIEHVKIVHFEAIMTKVLANLNTSYYKNDVVRAMQLMKYQLINQPKQLVEVINTLSPQKRREFIGELLAKDEILKEFKKTNQQRLATILKQAMIKPEQLAELLEQDVLNRKTRKPFVDSLLKQKHVKKITTKKQEKPLKSFFT